MCQGTSPREKASPGMVTDARPRTAATSTNSPTARSGDSHSLRTPWHHPSSLLSGTQRKRERFMPNISQPELPDDILPDFQTRFEALEKKLHERILDTENGLRKCHQLMANARGYSFEEFTAIVDSWLIASTTLLMTEKSPSDTSNPPSAVDILRFEMTYPYNGPLSAFSALQLAVAYWLEATKSFRIGDHTRSLPAIIISAHYLGMACAPPSAAEHFSDTTSKVHEKNTRRHRAEAVRLLEALAQCGGAESVDAMAIKIGWQFEAFNRTVNYHWGSENPEDLLKKWCRDKKRAPEVREAWLAAKAAWKLANKDHPSKRIAPQRNSR